MSALVESPLPHTHRRLRLLANVAALALCYFLAARLGLAFRTEPEKFAIFWPPNGLLVGWLLVTARRHWPPLLATAALTSIAANLLNHDSLLVCLGFTAVNVAEPILFAWLWRRFDPDEPHLGSASRVFLFFAAALAVCCLTALPGAAVVVLGLGAPDYPSVWLAFWLSDAMGIMLVAPLLLAWSDPPRFALSPRRGAEAVALFALLLATGFLVFTGHPTRAPYLFSFTFPLFPVLLWSALRFGLSGTTAATLALSLIAIWFTGREQGPFADPDAPATHRLLMVQFFLCVVSLSALVLAGTLAERQRVQSALAQSEQRFRLHEERYRALLETGPGVIVGIAADFTVFEWNRAAERVYGRPRQEVLGQDYLELFLPEEVRAAVAADIRKVLAGLPTPVYENDVFHIDGTRRTMMWNVTRVLDGRGEPMGILAIGQDITERKRIEERMRTSLSEKETLLKEVHHRVKNNLTVIGSLFYLQSIQTEDAQTLRLLRDCQERIRSMALVHESLYRSDDLAAIDFARYTDELAHHLVRTYPLKAGSIRLKIELERVDLSIERAIPCGLILNELVSNALEHAYPDGQSGELRVTLRKGTGTILILSVADDGVGLPEPFAPDAFASLGMKLIRSLTRQLDARLDFVRLAPGTEARLTLDLPDDPK